MSFNLTPPPSAKDPRFDEWTNLLWKFLTGKGAGIVTSVAATGANGIGVSGSPITTSGTLALTLGAITPTSIATGNITSTGTVSADDYLGMTNNELYAKDEPLTIASGNVLDVPSGMLAWTDATIWGTQAFTLNEPFESQSLFPGSVTIIDTDPYIIDAGYVVDLTGNKNTVLWTNASTVTNYVSTLLVIGV